MFKFILPYSFGFVIIFSIKIWKSGWFRNKINLQFKAQ